MSGVVVEIQHGEASRINAPGIAGFQSNADRSFAICLLGFPRAPVIARASIFAVPQTSFYKRSNFVTHLPVDCLYSPSHFWLARLEGDRWQVGFTKFATRMLGEIVDLQFEQQPGDPVAAGEIIGSIEGFKAISDIYCVGDGHFGGGNAALREDIERVGKEPYGAGWLYEFTGIPDTKCVSLQSYRQLLDATIDRILEKQQASDPP
jgi:glycine cleavage system H protein